MNREGCLKSPACGGKLPVWLIILYPLLFIWQGLDFTDTGYLLTNFQQIFLEPSSIQASFRIWLTDVLGGIWIYVFGDSLGLAGFRFAGVLLVWGTVYVSYVTLKSYIRPKYLVWGLFSALVLANRSGFVFNYNSLTAFFYVLAACLLVRGLSGGRNRLIFWAGFVLGLNVFIRLPNILGIFLAGAVLFSGYLKNTPAPVQIKQFLNFFFGYLLAAAAVLLVMRMVGHYEAYILLFQGTYPMLNDPAGHHRWDYVVLNYLSHNKTAVLRAVKAAAGLFSLLILLDVTSRFRSRAIQFGVIAVCASAFIYLYFRSLQDWVNLVITTLGILYLVLIFFVFKGQQELRLVSLISLAVLVLTPLGSNVAVRNSVYGMYLAVPVVFGSLLEVRETPFRLGSGELKMIKVLALGLFLILAVQSSYYYTYRDAGNRWDMRYGINHSRLRAVFTTRERAVVVQELLDVLPRYVREGDYLLAYEQISMVHFLTKTKPYLYHAWPMLYSPSQFAQALQRAGTERPYLPVIIRARGNTENHNWPETGGLLRSPSHDAIRVLMDGFIRAEGYRTVWQNSFFEILTPDEK